MDEKTNKNFILVNTIDQIISDSIRCDTYEHCEEPDIPLPPCPQMMDPKPIW
jgi:hypothetical protein